MNTGDKVRFYIRRGDEAQGTITAIEEQEVAGFKLELFVINFEKDKMTLRVPTAKAAQVGMRKLAESGILTRALDTIAGRARIKRTMWSRRAQEYEAKINSGDLVAIAEVVRDLQPRLVIPVQYVSGKTPKDCDQTSVEPFLKAMAGTTVKRTGAQISLPGKLSDGTVVPLDENQNPKLTQTGEDEEKVQT